MSVTLLDVEHVAALARLRFSPDEKERLLRELNTILGYVDQLAELDTSAVEPLDHVNDAADVLRPDEPRPCLDREETLRNAPARTEKFFRVPKVLGER
jgi:aspartyl-tRNA(Asn)/glutamyl-tRNA(Gln) amidotransferase subunit C